MLLASVPGAVAKPPRSPAPPRSGPRSVGAANARSPLGYNLDFPGDWSRLMPFLDLMRDARPWVGSCGAADPACDPTSHLDLDPAGWPRSLRYRDDPARAYARVETAFSTHVGVPDEGKTFLLTWEGDGELSWNGLEPVSKDLAQRRITFVFRPGNKFIRIEKTDPGGTGSYLRNIRICRLDRAPLLAVGEIFNPDTLEYLKPFGSLRFMDWMLSNNKEDRDAVWAERPRFDYFHWIEQWIDPGRPALGRRIGGYPVEVLVALANKVGADAHFNMPYRYTDAWVTGFATHVRDHLAPNLRATVEYSNEVWNWGFPQAGYANAEGRKLWPDEGSAWLQYMGMRAARMCTLWREVFAGQEDRLRCVIAPQTTWVDVAAASLDCPRWVAQNPARNKPCHKYADAVAVTGYFSGGLELEANRATIRAWLAKGEDFAIGQALRQLEHGDVPGLKDGEGKPLAGEASGSLDAAIGYLEKHKRVAQRRGLELYVYEGGTHLGSPDPQIQDFLFRVTAHERVHAMYLRLFSAYKALGGTIFNCWGWIAPRDPWANAQSLVDRARTKYRAIMDFVRQNPCWWPRCDRASR